MYWKYSSNFVLIPLWIIRSCVKKLVMASSNTREDLAFTRRPTVIFPQESEYTRG